MLQNVLVETEMHGRSQTIGVRDLSNEITSFLWPDMLEIGLLSFHSNCQYNTHGKPEFSPQQAIVKTFSRILIPAFLCDQIYIEKLLDVLVSRVDADLVHTRHHRCYFMGGRDRRFEALDAGLVCLLLRRGKQVLVVKIEESQEPDNTVSFSFNLPYDVQIFHDTCPEWTAIVYSSLVAMTTERNATFDESQMRRWFEGVMRITSSRT